MIEGGEETWYNRLPRVRSVMTGRYMLVLRPLLIITKASKIPLPANAFFFFTWSDVHLNGHSSWSVDITSQILVLKSKWKQMTIRTNGSRCPVSWTLGRKRLSKVRCKWSEIWFVIISYNCPYLDSGESGAVVKY